MIGVREHTEKAISASTEDQAAFYSNIYIGLDACEFLLKRSADPHIEDRFWRFVIYIHHSTYYQYS
jgi:hypothetical protein